MSAEIPKAADLFWQAFRYAGNEMTPVERRKFDALLSSDQQAHEAVARVVELEGLVVAAECQAGDSQAIESRSAGSKLQPAMTAGNHASTPNYWMQPMGWIAVGAAACLAVMMALQSWLPTNDASVPGKPGVQLALDGADGDAALAGELALAWAQAQAQLPVADDTASRPPAAAWAITAQSPTPDHVNLDSLDQELAGHELTRADDEQLPAAPDWLLAAVADTKAAEEVEN